MGIKLIAMIINQYNYFISTQAIFKGCKVPIRKPDYISFSKFYKKIELPISEIKEFITGKNVNYIFLTDEGYQYLTEKYGKISDKKLIRSYVNESVFFEYYPISSKYWYSNEYVIRVSNHWVNLSDFKTKKVKKGCNSIATCNWNLKTNNNIDKIKGGKCYFKDFTKIE